MSDPFAHWCSVHQVDHCPKCKLEAALKRIAALEVQLAACKTARDGFTRASDTAYARIAALEAQLAEREWRPIESAPRDKLILISLRRKHGTRVTVRACWYGENELENPDYIETEYAPSGWYESSAESEHCDALNGEPTHWMPLPQPPFSAS